MISGSLRQYIQQDCQTDCAHKAGKGLEMRKKLIIAGILLLLLVSGIVSFVILNGPDIMTTRIVLTGKEGLPITGQYTADGKEYPVNVVLPAEITISARRLSFLIASSDPSENVSAEVFVNDEHRVTGSQRQIEITVTGDRIFLPSLVRVRAFHESSENQFPSN